MKFITDLLPVILFFIAYKTYDIYVATAVAIGAALIQVVYLWFRYRKVEKMQLITLALLVVFGGLTLALRDPTFIKWKPTVINWAFAAAFLISALFMEKSLIQRMMGQALTLPKAIWSKLNYAWVIFFIFSGALNLYVAFNYDEATWVNFKLFGLMGLTLVFIIGQGIFLGRYLEPEETAEVKKEEI